MHKLNVGKPTSFLSDVNDNPRNGAKRGNRVNTAFPEEKKEGKKKKAAHDDSEGKKEKKKKK
jgi:hypothetical protein